jgi:hypothetical protein
MPQENNKSNFPYLPVIIGVGGVLILSGAVNKILEKFGLKDSQAASDNKDDASKDWWSPQYYKDVKNKRGFVNVLTPDSGDDFARYIYNALSGVFDNDNEVIAVFQQLTRKTEVSYLADRFMLKYGMGLYSFLLNGSGWSPASGMSDGNLKIVNDLVEKMKNE